MAVIDKVFKFLDKLVVRPIGLYNKDYRFMVEHLDRNIGNHDKNNYDGYSTPIGQLSNPYYLIQGSKAPWFMADNDKMRFANYLDYISTIYGGTYGILNINDNTSFPASNFDDIKVGKISSRLVNESLSSSFKNSSVPIFNPNGLNNDTKLGKVSASLLRKTLLAAIRENDKHDAHKFSISIPMIEYFGLNTKAKNNGILEKFISVNKETGRYENPSPLNDSDSPVYSHSKQWGNFRSLGVYEEYFKNTPSATTQSYIISNLSHNRYKPSLLDNNGKSNYLDKMAIKVGKETDYKGSQIRYIFETLHTSDTVYNNEGHTAGSLIGGLKAYGEAEGGKTHSYKFVTFNSGVNFGKYSTFDTDPIGVDDLLSRTNKGFMAGKYDTLIGRFHTSTDYPNDDLMSSSVSKAYGMSHGRNLLRGDAKNGKTFTKRGVGDGYDNPYCRVWTYHHQYHRMKDTIRPFVDNEPDGSKVMTPKTMQDKYHFDAFRNGNTVGLGSGGDRLTKYGVLGYKSNAGLVNIAPKKGVSIKDCMFSIENLAWKGMFNSASRNKYETNGLSAEQKGPFGGRIMWFPPYDIKFQENVTANWGSTSFIGRGEDIYTYSNTTRDGQLSFKLLIDHPAILDYWKRRNETDTSSNVDDVDAPEQQLLRFFAGCEMLSARPTHKKAAPKPVVNKPKPAPATKAFTFFIFYPNDYSGQDDRSSDMSIQYLLNGVGPQYRYTNKGSNRDNPDMFQWYSSNGNIVGGYEVRNSGVSIVKSATKQNGKTTSFITSLYRSKDKTKEYKLGKQIGSYKGKRVEWYYRVDNKRRNENLIHSVEYIDTASFRLNSGGQQDDIRKTFNVPSSTTIYPLTDVYLAFTNDTQAKKTLHGCYNESNVSAIKNIVENYGIKEITVKGWASSHGITINKSRNNDLNKNRRETALHWVKNCSLLRNKKITYKPLSGGVGPGPLASNISSLHPKLYRCSEVTVYVNTEAANTVQDTLKEKTTVQSETTTRTYGDTPFRYVNMSNIITGHTEVNDKTRVERIPDTGLTVGNRHINLNKMFKKPKVEHKTTVESANAKAREVIEEKKGDNKNTKTATNNIPQADNTVRRYDNEADFFKGLEMNDPIMRSKITEKIKYFDPAFHSISPEGFNARLNFLQQCTRQGPTIGNSDLSDAVGTTANNLSFGRPPICILRIGDFYYTKIVITSLGINYEPLSWDLNHEGIGVMPMMADITLNFHFIGGSNLSGPIARLQNALSFNYYANSEVYDDRAEQVIYNKDGDIPEHGFKTFPY